MIYEDYCICDVFGEFYFMGDVDYGYVIVGKFVYYVEYFVDYFWIKCGCWFIEQYDLWFYVQ